MFSTRLPLLSQAIRNGRKTPDIGKENSRPKTLGRRRVDWPGVDRNSPNDQRRDVARQRLDRVVLHLLRLYGDDFCCLLTGVGRLTLTTYRAFRQIFLHGDE